MIAVSTFLCSVGNVPFALVLWNAGIPFGGVLAFIFGDLTIPNIDNIYRKYYGLRMAGALFVSMFTVAVITGILIYYLAAWTGLIPEHGAGGTEGIHAHPQRVAHAGVSHRAVRDPPVVNADMSFVRPA